MDVSPSHNIIRIAGDYVTCRDVSLEVHNDVKDTHCEELAIAGTAKTSQGDHSADLWDALKKEPYLRQIEEMTGTVIVLSEPKSRNTLAMVRNGSCAFSAGSLQSDQSLLLGS